ncbi:hypothetical protein PTSG_10933 [Salpingoeca rosetta]|uniref:Uncharacterized protein n=1 Tax=Salpingoeca rosetta (strain ATCC 50818 / BSB-021) TaxID=946362 RepID=F2URF5_SALR5|nr:uncharacterized protein PTSG_10933 [Salpingoeca rosetta]EGD80258.1 hypothetical protein PTSG_10933 [Salpingoeca rosetta]|eukprot:XP_004988320.1 hypothetical protein PTSG_10933 [Salpingoeca rosetta]
MDVFHHHHHQQQQQQQGLEPEAVTPPPTTAALQQQQQHQQQPTHPPPPMQQQQRMHHHHHLLLNTSPNQPTKPSPNAAAGGSWLFAAGNRWRQHKLHFRLEAAAEGAVMVLGCAAAAVLMQYSYMHWEEQLWTHTSMAMAGTSNHSDAVISSVITVIIIAIDCTAAITLRLTPAPIWRDADIAHVSRSHEEPSSRPHETRQPRTDTIVLENATTTTNVRDLTTFTCRHINATLL